MQAVCGNRFRNDLHYAVVLATALAGLSLGGCTEKPDGPLVRASLAPMAEPELPSAAETARLPPASPTRVPRPLARKAAKKKPQFDPGTLIGLEPPAVDRMLGRPAGTHTDAMVVEWIYSGTNCSLSVFFYPDITTGALRALKYNVTNRQERDDRGCLNFPIVARSDGSD